MGNSKKLPEKKMCIVNQVKKNMRFVTNLPDAAHAGISRRLSPAGKHLDRSADLTACSPSGGGAARCCSYFTWSRKEGAAEKQNCIPGDKPRQVYHPPPSMPPPPLQAHSQGPEQGAPEPHPPRQERRLLNPEPHCRDSDLADAQCSQLATPHPTALPSLCHASPPLCPVTWPACTH